MKIQKLISLEDGAEFRFPGASDEEPGHDPGDLIIKVREKSSESQWKVCEQKDLRGIRISSVWRILSDPLHFY